MTDFGTTQSTCGQMLEAGHDRFELKYERNRKQEFKLSIRSSQQKLAGSTSVTPQCRNCHVSIENIRSWHLVMILRVISLFK
jgi:hypothetical protein